MRIPVIRIPVMRIPVIRIPVIRISVIRTIFWKTVLFISIGKVSVIRKYFSIPNDVLITGIHCIKTIPFVSILAHTRLVPLYTEK